MPNGYFLEGFVRFVDPADDGDVVSLPFMGFKENSKPSAVEKPVYDLVREGKDGFYYHVPKNLNISSSANVSALVTLKMTSSLHKKHDGRRITVLGIEENAEGTHSSAR